VKGVSELVQWTNSALNGRSPGVFRVFNAKTAANARRFLRDLERACPMRIRTILTDNGKEVTDRLFGLRKRAATGEHEFDTLCADLGIEHRLTPPKSPRTNGMVERFNGRITEVLQSHHFRSGEELETTLHRYAFGHSFGPCMDGSRGARVLFGSGSWSVAAMYTASGLQHDGCAPC
jgi:transposase InsO family protein